MVGSVERIAQEVAALDQRVAAIAQEFHSAYSDYLTALGQAVRQQLILASYHVCTQGYPESFLHLSYSQRYPLQKTLRHLAQQVQEELLAQLHIPVVIEEASLEEPDLDELQMLMHPTPHPPEPVAVSSANRSLIPTDLIQWQRDLEQAIVDELQTASHAANRLLQQVGILPKKLPQAILEAAAKADISEAGGNTPNVLSLLIDGGDSQSELEPSSTNEEPGRGSVMRVVAIHLRLTEVEFTDAASTALRARIRSLMAQLKTLARDYQKKQRERSISEAQAAWRSTWIED